MSDSVKFINALKKALLEADKTLDKTLAYYEGQEEQFSHNEDASFSYGLDKVTAFIEMVALSTKQYEIADISRALMEKSDRIWEIEQKLEEEHSKALETEAWESKPWISASEIGSRITPNLRGTEVNKLLESIGFLELINGGWVATQAASPHAIQRNIEDGKKAYVQWHKSIIDVLQRYLSANCSS
ncbi:MAG: hypothetical protein WC762_10810 [Methylobacter sp.]|jgi:hypothetical protein